MRYIHYGHDSFSRESFTPIENLARWIKPKGGLWGSRPDSEFNWKQWCIDNNYRLERLSEYFYFTLTPDAKILELRAIDDLAALPKIPGTESMQASVFLDYEKIREEYDAIEVFLDGDLDFQSTLCGWDCNSIIVLNPDIIRETPKFEFEIHGVKLFVEDLVRISNYYQAASTAEYLIENHREFDTLEKAMSVGYQVRDLMCLQDYSEAEAIDYVLSHR